MREKLIELLDEALLSVDWDSNDYPDTEKVAEMLIANGVTLDNQVSSSKWIPVSERLPDKDGVQRNADGFCSCGERKDNGTV